MRAVSQPAEMVALLREAVAADPVGGTTLGSVLLVVERDPSDAWLVVTSRGLAVRSARVYPAVVVGAWSADERAELCARLAALPELRSLCGEPELVDELAAGIGPEAHRMRQRLFRLDQLTPPTVPGSARAATPGDVELVVGWYEAFQAEAVGGRWTPNVAETVERVLAGEGRAWLWLDPSDAPVSLAVRRPVIFGSARIGPVYTPPELRRRGYGAAATAAATADVLAAGGVPVLFTDLANPVSNSIYPKLGYYPVEDQLRVTFGCG